MTDREAMQQALEALDWAADCIEPRKPINCDCPVCVASDALRERLVQPEQEPVAWVTGWHDGHCVIRAANPSAILPIGIALYTDPPRREWVGLTDREFQEATDGLEDLEDCWKAIEAKLEEKNK